MVYRIFLLYSNTLLAYSRLNHNHLEFDFSFTARFFIVVIERPFTSRFHLSSTFSNLLCFVLLPSTSAVSFCFYIARARPFSHIPLEYQSRALNKGYRIDSRTMLTQRPSIIGFIFTRITYILGRVLIHLFNRFFVGLILCRRFGTLLGRATRRLGSASGSHHDQ